MALVKCIVEILLFIIAMTSILYFFCASLSFSETLHYVPVMKMKAKTESARGGSLRKCGQGSVLEGIFIFWHILSSGCYAQLAGLHYSGFTEFPLEI